MLKTHLFQPVFLFVFGLVLALCQDVGAGEKQALIEAAELVRMRQAGPLKIIEILAPDRDAADILSPGHIPGAQLSPFKADGWVVDYDGLPGMLPPPEQLGALGARLGFGPNDTIVLVPVHTDIHGYAAAARAFWTLRMMGHQNLYLLNGGLEAYRASGARLAGKPHTATSAAPYPPAAPAPKWLAESGDVYAGDDYDTQPLDIRPTERSQGYSTHPLVYDPGTIFEAYNVPPVAFVADGRFKPTTVLHELMDDVIGKPPGPIVVFSDIGYRAAIGWFAIREVMGHKDVRLYDGSYVEWEGLGYETFDARNDMGDARG